MRWAHLPMAGGLYDQNPALIDRFHYILSEQSKQQERENAKRMSEKGGNIRGATHSGISRPRRVGR